MGRALVAADACCTSRLAAKSRSRCPGSASSSRRLWCLERPRPRQASSAANDTHSHTSQSLMIPHSPGSAAPSSRPPMSMNAARLKL